MKYAFFAAVAGVMGSSPDSWTYGDFAPDPESHDLVGLKARWVLRQMPAGNEPSILDYGAGEGKYLHLLRKAKPMARLVGVDIRKPHSAVDFEFHQVAADGDLPLANDSIDFVVSCDVLEHVDSIEHSLDEIQRVLRSGGSFAGFIPTEGGFGPYALFRLFDPDIYRDTKDHRHAYTRRELLTLLAYRFRVVRVAYSYHLLGATLDAAFFASFKIPGVGARVEQFWRGQDNTFYRTGAAATKRSLVSRLTKLANRAAYHESILLQNVALGAKGLHFLVEKR